jgi:hypothetical protein
LLVSRRRCASTEQLAAAAACQQPAACASCLPFGLCSDPPASRSAASSAAVGTRSVTLGGPECLVQAPAPSRTPTARDVRLASSQHAANACELLRLPAAPALELGKALNCTRSNVEYQTGCCAICVQTSAGPQARRTGQPAAAGIAARPPSTMRNTRARGPRGERMENMLLLVHTASGCAGESRV